MILFFGIYQEGVLLFNNVCVILIICHLILLKKENVSDSDLTCIIFCSLFSGFLQRRPALLIVIEITLQYHMDMHIKQANAYLVNVSRVC